MNEGFFSPARPIQCSPSKAGLHPGGASDPVTNSTCNHQIAATPLVIRAGEGDFTRQALARVFLGRLSSFHHCPRRFRNVAVDLTASLRQSHSLTTHLEIATSYDSNWAICSRAFRMGVRASELCSPDRPQHPRRVQKKDMDRLAEREDTSLLLDILE